ncbi:MAG TPA: PEGA domain-containing protein [Bryobacteraceae bacterium]|nr:PEGA domain-containing protein [Bryobacteraceae bacterium]
MKKLTLLFATALMALAPFSASAAFRGRVFVRPPVVGFGYGYGWGPYWGGGPFWGPGYGYYGGFYVPYDNRGAVKIDNNKHIEGASVYVNGAYAGLVKDNKTMHFRQGNYRIEIRDGNQTLFSDKVYVTAGKTIHINPAT